MREDSDSESKNQQQKLFSIVSLQKGKILSNSVIFVFWDLKIKIFLSAVLTVVFYV